MPPSQGQQYRTHRADTGDQPSYDQRPKRHCAKARGACHDEGKHEGDQGAGVRDPVLKGTAWSQEDSQTIVHAERPPSMVQRRELEDRCCDSSKPPHVGHDHSLPSSQHWLVPRYIIPSVLLHEHGQQCRGQCQKDENKPSARRHRLLALDALAHVREECDPGGNCEIYCPKTVCAAPAATTAIRAYTLVNNHETAPPRSAMGPWRGAPIQGSITTRPTCGASLQRRSATGQSFTDCILREDGLREKASNSAEPVIGTDTGKQFK